jgi:hypothetical protein
MFRAGVVEHPSQWGFSGYNEIQAPRQRYALIDYEGLKDLLGFKGMDALANAYRGWVEQSLRGLGRYRDGKWTESVAVGGEEFVAATKEKLGFKAQGREIIGESGTYELREPPVPYGGIFGYENAALRPENEYFWKDL